MKFYWNSIGPICLPVVYDTFHTETKLCSCNTDSIACKVLQRNNLQNPPLRTPFPLDFIRKKNYIHKPAYKTVTWSNIKQNARVSIGNKWNLENKYE